MNTILVPSIIYAELIDSLYNAAYQRYSTLRRMVGYTPDALRICAEYRRLMRRIMAEAAQFERTDGFVRITDPNSRSLCK